MPRLIRTPVGQEAHLIKDGDRYGVVLPGGTRRIGVLKSTGHGSKRVWSWALVNGGAFQGRYVDMGHAVQGLLHYRERQG